MSEKNVADKSANPSQMEASFSMLVMSIASSAAVSLGLAPDPQSHEMTPDKNMAKFNIDLLVMLKEKTKGQLNADEDKLINAIIGDLQTRFVQMK